jgi:hypothetical protein
MAVLPTPMITDRIGVAERDGLQPIDPNVDAVRVVAAGDFKIFTARRAAAHEDGVEALAQQILHAVYGRAIADVDAHAQNRISFKLQHTFRQPERGDVGAHQSAGLIVLFEDSDLVAQGHQIVGDCERGGPGSHAGHAFSVLAFRRARQQMLDTALQV